MTAGDDPEVGPQRFGNHMSAPDAVLWEIESDPVLRSTICAVAVLDRAPEWQRLVDRIELATRLIPRLRQRAVQPVPRLGPPRWVVDPDFELGYHLRRVRAPESATMRTLLDTIQPLCESALDRSRPLWEFTLVEGLEGGRAAFVQKLHHTLTDGVGAIELAAAMLDDTRDGTERELPDPPPPGNTEPLVAARDAFVDLARDALRTTVRLPLTGIGVATSFARHPLRTTVRAVGMTTSTARILAPVPRSPSPILTPRSLGRRFDTIEMPLVDLRSAGQRAGGSLNDAFLAGVVEGIRRYHAVHDVDLTELRLTMPVNLRHEGDELGGNHFAPVRFAVPTTIADPDERIRRMGAIARRWRAEPALDVSTTLAGALDRLPRPVTTRVFGAMLKHVDAVVTNVPGLPIPSFLAGAELEREFAFAPPTGAALNVSLLSHVGTACIGVVSDIAAVDDAELLLRCLAEGFADVLGPDAAPPRYTS